MNLLAKVIFKEMKHIDQRRLKHEKLYLNLLLCVRRNNKVFTLHYFLSNEEASRSIILCAQ